MKRLIWMVVIIIAIIVIDQVTKNAVSSSFRIGESVKVIDGFFNLTYARNSGAAFGFGYHFDDWIRYSLFLALPVIACLWLTYLLVKTIAGPLIMSLAYSLILGGAVGNLIDRFRLDYVVDFFDFYIGKSHFATFNVADASISVAAGLLIIDYFLQDKKKKNNEIEAVTENQ